MGIEEFVDDDETIVEVLECRNGQLCARVSLMNGLFIALV